MISHKSEYNFAYGIKSSFDNIYEARVGVEPRRLLKILNKEIQ